MTANGVHDFTDYVVTVTGKHDQESVFDYLENDILRVIPRIARGIVDVDLASHHCNDLGQSFHQVLGRHNVLLEDLQKFIDEIIREAAGDEKAPLPSGWVVMRLQAYMRKSNGTTDVDTGGHL